MIERKWHPQARSQRITVSKSREGMSVEAFTNWWHMHLVLDRRSIIFPTSIVEIAEEDTAAGCALAALCAGGGLTFSNERVLRATQADVSDDGQFRTIRVVRPEVRVVVLPNLKNRLNAVTAGGFPELPPWPAPSDVETIPILNEVSPPGGAAEQLAALCGFVVEPPRFGPRFDLEGWRGAHSIMRVSLSRLSGDPSEYLREWQERAWSDDVGVYEDPDEDGTGGFATDSLEEALERFGRYVRDIEEITEATRAVRLMTWDDFDFDAAVAALRDAEMPELILGMQHQSSKWPGCWTNMRRFFFALVDGSKFPAGVDDLPLPAYASGVERPIWCDPTMIAPDPSADSSDAFQLPDDLVRRLGIETILPIDPLNWRRADCLISGAADPFTDTDNQDEHECIARWRAWNSEYWRLPMVRLSHCLGEAVRSAYCDLANHLRSHDEDGPNEEEVLHALTLVRSIGIVSIPVTLCLLVAGIVLLSAGVLFGDGPQLLSVAFVLAWVLAATLAVSTSQRVVQSTRRYAYGVSEQWRWAMTVRHYALELTRLHGVARAFADHQASIRVMLHESSPRDDSRNSEGGQRENIDLPPGPLLVATAALDEDRWLREVQTVRARIVSEGWLEKAFDTVESLWAADFMTLVGKREFISPEDDYTPRGHTRYRVLGTGEPLPGSREHFRAQVSDNSELRIDARIRTAMEYAGIGDGQQLGLLGAVKVRQHPVIKGSASAFLKFEGSQALDFDPTIVRDGVAPVTVDPRSYIDSDGKPVKLGRSDSSGLESSYAALRMLVSAPLDPKNLRGIVYDSLGCDVGNNRDDLSESVI